MTTTFFPKPPGLTAEMKKAGKRYGVNSYGWKLLVAYYLLYGMPEKRGCCGGGVAGGAAGGPSGRGVLLERRGSAGTAKAQQGREVRRSASSVYSEEKTTNGFLKNPFPGEEYGFFRNPLQLLSTDDKKTETPTLLRFLVFYASFDWQRDAVVFPGHLYSGESSTSKNSPLYRCLGAHRQNLAVDLGGGLGLAHQELIKKKNVLGVAGLSGRAEPELMLLDPFDSGRNLLGGFERQYSAFAGLARKEWVEFFREALADLAWPPLSKWKFSLSGGSPLSRRDNVWS